MESTNQVLGKSLKQGERILEPTRRPDGSMRKAIRIRAGYVPQDEVAIYQPRGVLLRKAMPEVPPGYDPVENAKPKTKSMKRNERRKEKKQQASLSLLTSGEERNSELNTEGDEVTTKTTSSQDSLPASDQVAILENQMDMLTVSSGSSVGYPTDSSENPSAATLSFDLDKKIRAIKKKIRLAEEKQRGNGSDSKQQSERMQRIEGWRQELKILEEKKTTLSPTES